MTESFLIHASDIVTFLTYMEQGTATKAARRPGLSQQAVGARLRAFDEKLEIALFEDSKRGLPPTAAAKQLYEACSVHLARLTSVWGYELDALLKDDLEIATTKVAMSHIGQALRMLESGQFKHIHCTKTSAESLSIVVNREVRIADCLLDADDYHMIIREGLKVLRYQPFGIQVFLSKKSHKSLLGQHTLEHIDNTVGWVFQRSSLRDQKYLQVILGKEPSVIGTVENYDDALLLAESGFGAVLCTSSYATRHPVLIAMDFEVLNANVNNVVGAVVYREPLSLLENAL